MGTPKILIPKATICITELRRNPNVLKQLSDHQPTAISSRNKPIAYLLSTRAYETLLELIDDASLIQTVMARKGGNTIKVKI
jgi:prevent-host-death family protein